MGFMNFRGLAILPVAALMFTSAFAADISPVGTWRLTSFSQKVLETNETTNPFGTDPVGYIQYSPTGYVSVFLQAKDPKKPAGFPYTDAERAEVHRGIIGAYAGRYTVEGNKVTHHIEAAWRPDWIGDNQVRYLDMQGNRLTITTAPLIASGTGKQVISILTLDKAD